MPALVAGGVLIASRDVSPLVTDVPAGALTVPVADGFDDDAASASVVAERAEPFAAGPSVSGRVTSVDVTAGQTVATGDLLLSVDDRPQVAVVAGAPWWRDLGPGSAGTDVARLQRTLSDAGYYDGEVTSTFGPATAAAVRAFNADIGLGPVRNTFEFAVTVWVGPEPLTVHEVLVEVGDRVDLGTAVVEGPSRGARLVVTTTAVYTEPVELEVHGVVVDFDAASGEVTEPDAVAAVAAVLGTEATAIGVVRLREPRPVRVVPATAVVTAAAGALCVFPAPGAPPVPIEPVGGGLSDVYLPPDFEPAEVVANPRDVVDVTACT